MADQRERKERRLTAAQRAARDKQLAAEKEAQEAEAAKKAKEEAERPGAGVAGADRKLNEQGQTVLQDALGKLSKGEKPDTFSPLVYGVGSTTTPVAQPEKRALANPANYGKTGAARLKEARMASEDLRIKKLKKQGKALVYMGDIIAPKVKARYDEDFAQTESDAKAAEGQSIGDNIVEAQNLRGWLYDESRYNDIVKRARAVGLNPQSFDDVEKLWDKALERASLAFATGQKVTPWAILGMMGKNSQGGKSTRTTTDVAIDEMDPATARRMVQNAAKELLGKDPSEAQVDDFIARAQLVARSNPRVTKTTSQLGFDGAIESQSSITTGGGQAVSDQAALEAEEMMKADPEYGEIQASTTYMNALMDAINSPVG